MYSRAERKFLISDSSRQNPQLGPGSYTHKEPQFTQQGYAPFSSLTPRMSCFDDTVHGPAPGAYDAPTAIQSRSSLFGRSKASRFDLKSDHYPGPSSYTLPSSLHLKKKKSHIAAAGHQKSSIQDHPLTQQPMLTFTLPETSTEMPIQSMNPSTPMDALLEESMESHASLDPSPIQQNTHHAVLNMGPHAFRIPSTTAAKPSRAFKTPTTTKAKITWKRKHVPPSIPTFHQSFGYKETQDGELLPRKPAVEAKDAPAINLTSFTEASKHNNRGYTFGQGGKQDSRIQYKINQGPGPDAYDPDHAESYLRQGSKNAALMALSPCVRLTDELLSQSLKKSIPGPGAYEIKPPMTAKLSEKRNRIRIGGNTGHTGCLNLSQLANPGPGSYYPEYANASKPQSRKVGSFGSTTKRFENEKLRFKSQSMPAPGSYDIEKMDSMFQRVQNKIQEASLNPAIAFGSFTDRFKHKVATLDPGPGQYDLEYEIKNVKSKNDKPISSKSESRVAQLLQKGPTRYKIGNMYMNAAQVHIPVFGTQTDRFENKNSDLPPPGAYEIEKAFKNIHNKGKLLTGIMTSQFKRQLFAQKDATPGPGEYDVKVALEANIAKLEKSSFVSTEPRFVEKREAVPGPDAYTKETSLIKKTFNVTY